MSARFALIVLGILLAHHAVADDLPIAHQACASDWAKMGRQGYLLGAMNASPEVARLMVNAGDGKLADVRRQLLAMPKAEIRQWRQAAMITAAWAGQSRVVDGLLADGAEVDAQALLPNYSKEFIAQEMAMSPLAQSAAKAGLVDQGALRTSGPALAIAIECGDEATVKVLLDHQANANLRTSGKNTAGVVIWAVMQGDAENVRVLLDHGVDVCAEDLRIRQHNLAYQKKYPDRKNSRPLQTYAEIARRARLPADVIARLACPAFDSAATPTQ